MADEFHGECNAFCRPDRGEHADVVWCSQDLEPNWAGVVMEPIAAARRSRVTILDVKPAHEAPEYRAGTGPHRRLIRWREPIVQVQVDGEWRTIGREVPAAGREEG